MKRNTDKCHLLPDKNYKMQLKIANIFSPSSNSISEKLLDLKNDKKLSFDVHLKNIC